MRRVRRTQCSTRQGWRHDIPSGRQGVVGAGVCGPAGPRVTLQWPALTISEEKSGIPVCMSTFPFFNDDREVLKYHVGQTQLGLRCPKTTRAFASPYVASVF